MRTRNGENQSARAKPLQRRDIGIVVITRDIREGNESELCTTSHEDERSKVVTTPACYCEYLTIRTPRSRTRLKLRDICEQGHSARRNDRGTVHVLNPERLRQRRVGPLNARTYCLSGDSTRAGSSEKACSPISNSATKGRKHLCTTGRASDA